MSQGAFLKVISSVPERDLEALRHLEGPIKAFRIGKWVRHVAAGIIVMMSALAVLSALFFGVTSFELVFFAAVSSFAAIVLVCSQLYLVSKARIIDKRLLEAPILLEKKTHFDEESESTKRFLAERLRVAEKLVELGEKRLSEFKETEFIDSLEKAMKAINKSSAASPNFLDGVVESGIDSEAIKHFIRKEKLSVEEVLELLDVLPDFLLEEGDLRRKLSPRLFYKASSYGIKWLKSAALLIDDVQSIGRRFRLFCLRNCPFFFLSCFLESCFEGASLIKLKERFRPGENFSLPEVAACSVSRIGLSSRHAPIFSKKYWTFASHASTYELAYTSMASFYVSKDATFKVVARFFKDSFQGFIASQSIDSESIPVDLSEEDLSLLCEHGLSFPGLQLLSSLPKNKLELFQEMTDLDGRNFLADLMFSFGDRLLFFTGDEGAWNCARFLSVFSEEQLSCRPRSRSIRGVTWEEMRILFQWAKDGKDEEIERFFSVLEEDEIEISRCEDQSWYARGRLYDFSSESVYSTEERTSRQQAIALPWINWNRSIYRKGRIRKDKL
ncbi:DUF1389 domain-containing protein [Chlamydiifrater phoenicopteri]|uniref:DUF1389 domain-containing protein n=1 Tax=Chlamydiifrater phoenicopteri TaxID=2681469 RepID=UPI001BCF62AE|nr:DUF1389 domain-containing protein [Chlamydiifrater phoenicopteri]